MRRTPRLRLSAGRLADLEPVIFRTARGNVPMVVPQAIKTGAFEFPVTKPFAVGVLLDAVLQSLECNRARDPAHAELHALGAGYATIGSDT